MVGSQIFKYRSVASSVLMKPHPQPTFSYKNPTQSLVFPISLSPLLLLGFLCFCEVGQTSQEQRNPIPFLPGNTIKEKKKKKIYHGFPVLCKGQEALECFEGDTYSNGTKRFDLKEKVHHGHEFNGEEREAVQKICYQLLHVPSPSLQRQRYDTWRFQHTGLWVFLQQHSH